VKRIFDIAVAATGLTLTAPLLAMLAAAVKLDSPGPVFYIQTRVGRGRKPIRVAKLRTMRVDTSGSSITADRDPRITRVGSFLRKAKLDELPQLWNVLRGDMSIVGPRPEVPRYVDQYREDWLPLLAVRPGLTDVASLTFRDEEQLLALAHDRERAYTEVIMPMKLELALRGVTAGSMRTDVATIVQTIAAVFRVSGSQREAVIREARRRIEDLNRGTEGT
jgi:lipopolysaccharide/colanic/teichoic acid biosynthesis glycosyltransferase